MFWTASVPKQSGRARFSLEAQTAPNLPLPEDILIIPLVPLWVGSVSNLSLWLVRLKRRWIRPRRRTLSSLSEDGIDKLLSSSRERSESESESSPKAQKTEREKKKIFISQKDKCENFYWETAYNKN